MCVQCLGAISQYGQNIVCKLCNEGMVLHGEYGICWIYSIVSCSSTAWIHLLFRGGSHSGGSKSSDKSQQTKILFPFFLRHPCSFASTLLKQITSFSPCHFISSALNLNWFFIFSNILTLELYAERTMCMHLCAHVQLPEMFHYIYYIIEPLRQNAC